MPTHFSASVPRHQCPMVWSPTSNESDHYCLFPKGHSGPHGQENGLAPRWTDEGEFWHTNQCMHLDPDSGWQCEQFNVEHTAHYAWGPVGHGIKRWAGLYVPVTYPRTYAQRKRGRHGRAS